MSNIERIRQKIERLYDGEAPKHDQQCDFNDGYFTGIAIIAKFIDSLSEEMPSEDLEEAADEYADDNFEQWVEDDEIYSDADKIRETFIAGAEWMSKQMNNE